jgi:DNA polymerase-3 subunit delta'
MHNIFPWCENTWKNLISSVQKNRLPHAILFYGNKGLGKKEVAQQLAQYLLCSDPQKNQHACGSCKDCHLFSVNTHGDFYNILPENSKGIGIDQVRHIKSEANQKPQRHQVKVFLISDADKMSIAASNALLKVLEEPPGGSIFILTCERKHALSPTVLSRCQHFAFIVPDAEKTQQWLLASDDFYERDIKDAIFWSLGAPLLAKQLLENNTLIEYQSYSKSLLACFSGENTFFSLTKAWQGKPLVDIIYVAQMTCYYLLKGEWGITFDKQQVYQWLKKIVDIKKMMATHIALNEALIIDSLLVGIKL